MALSRLGQVNATGDANALFLKVFSGEVLSTFAEANKFMDKGIVRTISSGKSAQFPVVGTASAAWHTPGESVISDTDAGGGAYLSSVNQNEREIFIDDCLVSGVMIDDLDSLKNHWDHRSEYSSLIGRALAKEADQHILATALAAGLTETANVTGGPTNAIVTEAAADTSVADFISAIFKAADSWIWWTFLKRIVGVLYPPASITTWRVLTRSWSIATTLMLATATSLLVLFFVLLVSTLLRLTTSAAVTFLQSLIAAP